MKHLLIDFENIKPQNLDNIPDNDTHIWLFLGVTNKMLPVDLVQSLLRFGERAHLIRLQRSGKNALDFYLSYHLGRITASDPEAQISILSCDGGYDVLVEHILKTPYAQCIVRLENINDVQSTPITHDASAILENKPSTETPTQTPPSLAPYFQAALNALRQPNAFRPSHLHNLHQNLRKYILQELLTGKTNEECEATIEKLIQRLKTQKFITIDEQNRVSYHISNDDLLQKIQAHIFSVRPKTFAEFQAAVQKRANALGLTINTGDIQKLAQHLCQQNLIQQNNGEIEYPPFSQPAPNIYQPDKAIWDRIIATLSLANRPKKINTLRNVIKSHAHPCSETEIDSLIQHLQDTKILRIQDSTIVYFTK